MDGKLGRSKGNSSFSPRSSIDFSLKTREARRLFLVYFSFYFFDKKISASVEAGGSRLILRSAF